METIAAYRDNLEYLCDELRRLDLHVKRSVMQFRQRRDTHPEFRGLYISDEEIDGLMGSADTSQAASEIGHQIMVLRDEVQQRVTASEQSGIALRLPYLGAAFGLSLFELDLLLLAFAPELDRRYQKLYAYLQDDVSRKRPSVDFALHLFCLTLDERVRAREVFADSSPLLAFSLLTLHEDPMEKPVPLLGRSLKLDDRMAEFILGSDRLDGRLSTYQRMARWVKPLIGLDDLVMTEDVRALLLRVASIARADPPLFCILHGPPGVGKKSVAEAICHGCGCSLLVLDVSTMLMSDTAFRILLRVAFREARLYGSAVYLDRWQALMKDDPMCLAAIREVEQEIEQFPGVVFVGSHSSWQPTHISRSRFITVELPLPHARLRRMLWEPNLRNGHDSDAEVDLSHLSNAFRFTGGQICQAIARAEQHALMQGGERDRLTMDDLFAGCRMESTQQLITFAKKISPKRVWADLVLPQDTLAQLHELCHHVRYRARVYNDWGFDQRLSLGKGLIALLTGTSGTGKTLSAEILANELGLDLYKVDLSCVVSKYIGETEKNLSRVFQEAQESNAILFFDEADALFGKRSEVKDAHDRYANIEINYLLQRVEEYEGVIILASNMSKNIDAAFLRRMHFCIEFPFPDEGHRRRIWQGIFPSQAPLATDLDFDFLASKFKIAGGNIKNVALAAAFLAAEEDSTIRMEHLMFALKREYQKLGKVCERAEFEQYYELVRS